MKEIKKGHAVVLNKYAGLQRCFKMVNNALKTILWLMSRCTVLIEQLREKPAMSGTEAGQSTSGTSILVVDAL